MGNFFDEFGNLVHGVESTTVDAFDSVAKELMNWGLPGVPNYIIQCYLDEGWAVADIPGEILRIYQVISSAGIDFVSAIDQFVSGSIAYGSPAAYVGHEMRTHYETIISHLASMVTDWKQVGQTPLDLLSDLDHVLAGFGTGPGTQGATTATYMQQYSAIKAQIVQLAQPMASSPWDGKDYGQQLDDFWNTFLNQSGAALESDINDGSMVWRVSAIILLGVAVAVVLFAPTEALSIAGTPFSFGLSAAAGQVAVAGIGLLYVLACMEILNILQPFVIFVLCVVGMLVDMLVVAPLQWVGQEVELAFTHAAQATQQQIQEVAEATGIALGIIEKWAEMGLTAAQLWTAAELYLTYAAYGLTAYDAGRFAQELNAAQLREVHSWIGAWLAHLCGGILGWSDFIIEALQMGINPANQEAVAQSNPLVQKLFNLIADAQSPTLEESDRLGAQRVLAVLNKIGLQNVADIDLPSASGGRGADIVLKGEPPVAIEVGGPGKAEDEAAFASQLQSYIDKYGVKNVRVYIQNDNGSGDQAMKAAEGKVGADNVIPFTEEDLKCVH